MSELQVLGYLRDGGAYAVLIFALIGGYKGWYVWRWTYDAAVHALEKDRDEWKQIGKAGLQVAKSTLPDPIPPGQR